ncbi:type II toxin-antitoxin system Phd/YefM family antitoxin [Microbacterium sp. LWH11-1.2]|uniref:type II toxin-antitoxin system Phd/YefM family antitoxin n=1 Tax=Microbacterium sp. LWH11-1.2 TaxID=3135258 RepID=UPI003139901A
MTTLSVASARASFSKLVDSAASTHERFEVTRNGERVAVLLGADDFDAMQETIAVLSDAEVLNDIRDAADGERFTVDDVRQAMEQRRSPGAA